MSVTIDATTGGSAALGERFLKGFFRVVKTIDLAQIVANDNAGVALTTGDIIKAIDIPANTVVLGVHCKVHVAEGAACTIDVGVTGGSANGFLDDVNLNSTATSVMTAHTAPYGTDNMMGKLFTSAGTIDILCNSSGTNAAVITLSALCADVSASDYHA